MPVPAPAKKVVGIGKVNASAKTVARLEREEQNRHYLTDLLLDRGIIFFEARNQHSLHPANAR